MEADRGRLLCQLVEILMSMPHKGPTQNAENRCGAERNALWVFDDFRFKKARKVLGRVKNFSHFSLQPLA